MAALQGGAAHLERQAWRIDVSESVEPEGRFEIAADAVLPTRVGADPPAALFFCLPGGFLDRRYFDLGDPANPLEGGYSMAAYLAAHGLPVVAVDHVGTGASSGPARIEDGYLLDIDEVVRANQAAFEQVRTRVAAHYGLENTSLPCVGVGHSMGSLLSVAQQATYAPHSALVLQTFSIAGLPDFLGADELALANAPSRLRAALPRLVKARFGTPYPALAGNDGNERSQAFSVGTAGPLAKRLLDDVATVLPAMCGLPTMIPGAFAPYADKVSVPVFVSAGDHDLVGASASAQMLPNAPEVVSYRLADAWHCHNVANTRMRLWERIARWVFSLTADEAP